jgi:hypothetical protein
MKSAIIALLSFAAVSCAQDSKSAPQAKQGQDSKQGEASRNAQPPKEPEARNGATKKLASVTWNLNTHKLIWTIATGKTVNGSFVPSSEDRYEISPDDAVMAFSNEKRGFTPEEASSLHRLLDVLSLYCAESVVWWDEGQGVPIDPSGKQPEKAKPGGKPTKVDEKQKTPPRRPANTVDLVALAQLAR